jgi:transcriptional regulator with XRE-family HTH domain
MKRYSTAEAMVLKEILEIGNKCISTMRGQTIGQLVRAIRNQLGMTQKVLAQRSGVPQSTISRIEKSHWDVNISTLKKVLSAISCDLLIVPVLTIPIETQRKAQARKKASQKIEYLSGTMYLENQKPSQDYLSELRKTEEERLLYTEKTKLWEES